jgi:hypothetical protein
MVEIASFRRKGILFHSYSTFPCGLGKKDFSEQGISNTDSAKEEENKTKLR